MRNLQFTQTDVIFFFFQAKGTIQQKQDICENLCLFCPKWVSQSSNFSWSSHNIDSTCSPTQKVHSIIFDTHNTIYITQYTYTQVYKCTFFYFKDFFKDRKSSFFFFNKFLEGKLKWGKKQDFQLSNRLIPLWDFLLLHLHRC